MPQTSKAAILLVDDQPAKLLSYEVILKELGQQLVKASSGREALDLLLRHDVAVILMDVSMPDMDGFQLAALIRDHPRYCKTAIIFVSAVHLNEADYARGYQMGGVDYVSVPVVPEVLRAKVRVFVDLYRKTRELEALNKELEARVIERTEELRLSNDHQITLAREVDHRAKNALAVAQAIVRLTQGSSVEEYVAAVEGRITALARAHALLSEARWQGASIRRLVEEELEPYRDMIGNRVSVVGPDFVLKPANAQALALAIHELATNAAKYGAFSRPGGSLRVSWEADTAFRINWQEGGIENVKPPTSKGFGTKVIALGIERQLNGDVTYRWREDGLHCTLAIPIATESRDRDDSGRNVRTDGSDAILVVEDEPLVALMLERSVSDMGYEVIGPVATVGDALIAARAGGFAGAILDVNLGGELVFPVADKLSERNIPFVFTTGYGPERIHARYSRIPVLHKPVEESDLRATLMEVLQSAKP